MEFSGKRIMQTFIKMSRPQHKHCSAKRKGKLLEGERAWLTESKVHVSRGLETAAHPDITNQPSFSALLTLTLLFIVMQKYTPRSAAPGVVIVPPPPPPPPLGGGVSGAQNVSLISSLVIQIYSNPNGLPE